MPDITQLSDEELKRLAAGVGKLSDEELKRLASERGLAPKPSQTLMGARFGMVDPNPPPGESRAEKLDDLVRSIASGASFGLADEFAAGASALTGVGGQAEGRDYETLLAAERARDEATPLGPRVAGEIAGGVATGGLAGKAVTKGLPWVATQFSKLPGWLKASGLGAGYGTAYGFGGGEGGVKERAESALGGAETGMLLGAAGYPVVKGAVWGGGKLLDAVRKRWGDPTASARAKVAEAATRDEMTPQKMQQRLEDLGPQGTIYDVGGRNVQSLGRHTANVPGPAQNRATTQLNQRAEGASRRINRAVAKGLAPEDYFAAEESFLANLKNKAGSMYQKAYKKFPIVKSPALTKLLTSDTGKKALKEAAEINQIERDAGLVTDILEETVQTEDLSLEMWDDYKRGFDSLLKAPKYSNELTGKLNHKGRALYAFQKKLMKELDKQTGGKMGPYALARKRYAGDAEVLDALRDGRKALNWDPERITKYMGDLSDAGKESFRSGISRALKDVVAKVPDPSGAGVGPAKRIFGTVLKREQIRAAFPDAESFRQLSKALTAEMQFAKGRNYALGGSDTVQKAQASADALSRAGEMGGVVAGTQAGKLLGAHTLMSAGIGRRVGAALMGKTKAHDLEAAKLLFTRDPAANKRAIDTLFTRSVWDGLPESVKRKIGQALLVGAGQQGAEAQNVFEGAIQ